MAIQTIDRAVRVMRVVAQLGPVSLTAISDELELPLPTVSRIVKSLLGHGLLTRRDDRRYELGARLLPMVTPLEPFKRSLAVVHPYIEELSEKTKADCGLAVLQGEQAVVVDWCYGPYPPRIIEPYSREVPLYCAFGMVLVAFQPKEWRKRYLHQVELKQIAEGTVPDRTTLCEKVEIIRRNRIHLSIAENIDHAGSLTVPVFDHISRIFGALFITAKQEYFEECRIDIYKKEISNTAQSLRTALSKLHMDTMSASGRTRSRL